MASAYDFLAEWFEFLNDDCDYSKWSQYFINGLRERGAGKRGLELGCGNGTFCRALAKAGYAMTGADISAPMLNRARDLARKEGLNLEFVLSDAARLKVPEKFDFILSPNDCFNYIPPEKLAAAFTHVARALTKEGIFWFDVSSEYKLRQKVANNMFGDDRDDVTYIAFNTLRENRVETDVTLFVREGELFRRYDEQHVRYIHSGEAIDAALRQAGFKQITCEGHLGEKTEGSDRLNFICKKVSS